MHRDEYHGVAAPRPAGDVASEAAEGENEHSGKIGIGRILRNERERKGITYAQITEITRVRPHILEALENEEWARLPPRVIVTGFIRSYARALGLEEGEIVGPYQKTAPPEASASHPLADPTCSRRNLAVFLVFLMVTQCLSVLLLLGYPDCLGGAVAGGGLANDGNETFIVDSRKASEKWSGLRRQPLKSAAVVLPGANQRGHLLPRTAVSAGPALRGAGALHGRGSPGQGEPPRLTLLCAAKEMTWLKIFVDDRGPKDVMLQAGERFQWKAERGFELVIGNAAGLDLVFDGKAIKSLGGAGEVVRLKLPEDFQRSASED